MLSYKSDQNFTKYHSSETTQFVQVEKAPKVKKPKRYFKCVVEMRTKYDKENTVPHYGKPVLSINFLFINISM